MSTIKANPFASASYGAGGLLSAGQSVLTGIQSNEADQNVASLYKQQAQLDLYNAGREVQATQTKATQTISAGEAEAGAGGVTSAGSPALATAKTVSDANIADIYSRYTGKIKSASDLYQAQLEEYSGKQAETAGYVGGAASLFSSAAEIAAL